MGARALPHSLAAHHAGRVDTPPLRRAAFSPSPRRPCGLQWCLLRRPSRPAPSPRSPALASLRPGARSHPGSKVLTTWARVARAPLAARLAPPTSRGSAPPRPRPAPPGLPRAPSLQPRRRAGQRSGGGGGRGGSEGGGGGGGSGRCSPTLRRQAGGATEAGPQEDGG